MRSSSSKGSKSFINRYATKSVAYEILIWMLFWGLYMLWAGYSPIYPKSDSSEPLFPLVVLCFMSAFFFIFGDRKELKLLITNSAMALIAVPGLLVLNIYRGLSKKLPDSWAAAGFFGSAYVFFFLQFVFLVLSILLVRYTWSCWKTADPAVKKRYYWAVGVIVVFFLCLSALVAMFVLPGRTTP